MGGEIPKGPSAKLQNSEVVQILIALRYKK